ncbi:carbohydrate ABC transporter permease [Actinoplanes sp. NPDC051343]|jgi:multiple sugar transport system permease protein|uniref:carbohydrate ABC transporter permease n=1 Tax=Actinoplanes sp. NPDC051343 TaxID=3363906 RepID=UPI0037B16FD8
MSTTTRVPLRTGKQAPSASEGSKRKRRGSLTLTVLTALVGLYALVPLGWLVINATKTQDGLFTSFGLWFDDGHFALWDNLRDTLTYDHGIYLRWLGNTLLYVVVGAGGATFLCVLAGYGLSKFEFVGKRAVFGTVLGAVAVPPSALAVPTFLMFSKLGLTNTPWAVLVPSLICPFGLYLMWTFTTQAIPDEMLEAARMDGASEMRTFFRISVPLLAPGIVTTLLFSMVVTMNNYLLPLIMLKNPDWYPLTVGLNAWNAQATTAGGQAVFNLVITGSLIMIALLLAAFLSLQRYWQSGLAAGSVKE